VGKDDGEEGGKEEEKVEVVAGDGAAVRGMGRGGLVEEVGKLW
jgi:hypothetical protein